MLGIGVSHLVRTIAERQHGVGKRWEAGVVGARVVRIGWGRPGGERGVSSPEGKAKSPLEGA